MLKSSLILLSALGLSACVTTTTHSSGQTKSAKQIQSIVPPELQQNYDNFHYSPAVRVGDMVILSGVVAALNEGETQADMGAAFERAFEEIDLVLKAANADWSDIVEIQTFHTELLPQLQAFAEVKDRWIKEPYPAWTALDIDGLYIESGLVEIKITAYSP